MASNRRSGTTCVGRFVAQGDPSAVATGTGLRSMRGCGPGWHAAINRSGRDRVTSVPGVRRRRVAGGREREVRCAVMRSAAVFVRAPMRTDGQPLRIVFGWQQDIPL